MAISKELKEKVLAIPDNGFWKSRAEDTYIYHAELLKSKDLTDDEIINILNDLYWHTAECFGGY